MRCLDCIAGGRMMAALLSGDGMLPADWLRLCADMADHADAAALGNAIRLSEHRAQRASRPWGSAPGSPEEATL